MIIIFFFFIFGLVYLCWLGVLFGINLFFFDGKVCFFDCIYCECGYNGEYCFKFLLLICEEVCMVLEEKLKEMKSNGFVFDVLIFVGNGELIVYFYFLEIIEDIFVLCDVYFLDVKVSVFSNVIFINCLVVFDVLNRVDNNILKLDMVDEEYIWIVDCLNG